VNEAVTDFAAAIEQTPELRAVLRNPQLETSAKRISPATRSRCSRTSCSS
jgi:F0F1-type ATP synthase delta subunit